MNRTSPRYAARRRAALYAALFFCVGLSASCSGDITSAGALDKEPPDATTADTPDVTIAPQPSSTPPPPGVSPAVTPDTVAPPGGVDPVDPVENPPVNPGMEPTVNPVVAPPTTDPQSTNPAGTTPPTNSGSPVPPPSETTPDDISPFEPAPPGQSAPPTSSVAPPGSQPLGLETTCDGTDDDQNGVVDDVDQGKDGVCDCLRVASLGLHGEWGSGDVLTGWLADRVNGAAVAIDGEPLSEAALAPYHVLLIRDVSTNHTAGLSFSVTEADALWNWVREGGGLMTVIGYSDATEINNVNRLLEPFSLSYGSEQVVQGSGSAAPITEWFEHPLTVGVTQVGGDNGYPAQGQGTTIAAQDGFDMGKAAVIGDGHVLVWGDEWVTYEAEWADSSMFQVDRFWENALRWLTRATECQVPPRPIDP